MDAIEIIKTYTKHYEEKFQHKASPAMIKFNLREHYAAIAELKLLQSDLAALQEQTRKQNILLKKKLTDDNK